MREIHLLVLAGGFGTRLRSVVPDLPKPLAPVVGTPFLKYQIDAWESQGATKITFLLHYRAEAIESYLYTRAQLNPNAMAQYKVVIEPEPLGTGGAIAHALRNSTCIKEDFYVVNADTWLANGLAVMAGSTAPAIGLVHVEDSGRYGQVVTENGRIASFLEKQSNGSCGWINAGIYHLVPSLFDGWDGHPFSLESDFFPELIQSQKVVGIPLDSDFIDIGIPDDYRKFCDAIAGH